MNDNHSQPISIGSAAALFIVSGALFAFPSLFETMQSAIFISDQPPPPGGHFSDIADRVRAMMNSMAGLIRAPFYLAGLWFAVNGVFLLWEITGGRGAESAQEPSPSSSDAPEDPFANPEFPRPKPPGHRSDPRAK